MSTALRPFQALGGSWRWLFWRVLVFVLVVAAGVTGLDAGVGMSERPGVSAAGFLTKVYYTLGLFVFGGLDLGVPRGGPPWGRALLWLTYFAAPAITTSALVEGVLVLVRPHAWRLRRLRNHVVIGGCGRLALLYLERLRERFPKRQVLVVERRTDHPLLETMSELSRTQILHGDISSEAVLKALRLDRVRSVVLLTGDDYANLDAASRICQIRPDLSRRILVHVSDIRLLRTIEKRGILPEVAKFNSYRSAAQHLVADTLVPHFQLTKRLDTVVLAGFGRFGQTVLDELQHQAAGLLQTVVIIDLEAELRTMVFAEQVGFAAGYRHETVDADLRHPATWQRVQEMIGEPATPRPVFILGSGDDGVNIRTALWLSSKFTDAKIVARCFDQSSFTRQISQECGFEIVSTAELLLASMRPDWLAADTR